MAGSAVAFGVWHRRCVGDARDTERPYRFATDLSDDAFFVFAPVHARGRIADWKITECNQGAVQMWGLQREELVGALVSSLYTSTEFRNLCEIFAWALEGGRHEDEYPEDFAALRPIIDNMNNMDSSMLRPQCQALAHCHASVFFLTADATSAAKERRMCRDAADLMREPLHCAISERAHAGRLSTHSLQG